MQRRRGSSGGERGPVARRRSWSAKGLTDRTRQISHRLALQDPFGTALVSTDYVAYRKIHHLMRYFEGSAQSSFPPVYRQSHQRRRGIRIRSLAGVAGLRESYAANENIDGDGVVV